MGINDARLIIDESGFLPNKQRCLVGAVVNIAGDGKVDKWTVAVFGGFGIETFSKAIDRG